MLLKQWLQIAALVIKNLEINYLILSVDYISILNILQIEPLENLKKDKEFLQQ